MALINGNLIDGVGEHVRGWVVGENRLTSMEFHGKFSCRCSEVTLEKLVVPRIVLMRKK